MTVKKLTAWSKFSSNRTNRQAPDFVVYAAAYLPFEPNGEDIDWDGFAAVLRRIFACGAIPVVNADTGFAFHPLVTRKKPEVLAFVAREFPGSPYVAAVTPPREKAAVFNSAAYQVEIDIALATGATEIMVMISPGLTALADDALVAAYGAMKIPDGRGILHELTNQFVPFGRVFTPYEFLHVLRLPAFKAVKTSELFGNCMVPRMNLKDQTGLSDVRILSGVDYCVREAFIYCDGVLMGAATPLPEMYTLAAKLYHEGCSKPDEMWKFERLVTNLQTVAGHQFHPFSSRVNGRLDVGGYRHITAYYLEAQGTIRHSSQPAGTDDFHLRDAGATQAVRGNLLMLNDTLSAIGSDFKLSISE